METNTQIHDFEEGISSHDHRFLVRVGLILLVTLIVYAPALRGRFIWDDQQNIAENPSLRSLDGLKQIWASPSASFQYYPLTYTSFWIEYHLWGLHPFGYHLVNVLLHALNAVLLWILLRRLSVPGAWLAALLFAVHPVHVESVAWITERKNVLSGFFGLLAALVYLRFVNSKQHNWWLYAAAFGLFACALFAKTTTVCLPGAVLLLLWWKRGRLRLNDIGPLVPFAIAGAALSLLTISVEANQVGARGPEWALTAAERCLVAGRAVWFYAGKLVWPQPLVFIYPRWQLNPRSLWPYVYPVAAIAAAFVLWSLRRRIGRCPFVAWVYFVCLTAPVPAFINLFFTRYSFVADHFQYLASMGGIALAVAAITRVTRPGMTRNIVFAAIIVVFGALSWQRCEAFRDEETLWRDTLAKNPSAWMAWNNLGLVREQSGDLEEALACYDQALQVKPDFAEAHINFANFLSRAGRIQDAIKHYNAAFQTDPPRADAHYNLGLALAQAGDPDGAITQYKEALQIRPNYAAAENNLGYALWQSGKPSEAIAHFEAALRIDPVFAEAHNNLGVLFASQGRTGEAIAHYRQALEIQPDYTKALNNLAWTLATDDAIAPEDRAAAAPLAERVCQLTDYRQPVCLDVLAAAYAAAGRFSDAIRVADQAIVLANSASQTKLAKDIEGRLGLYKANRPFRQSRSVVAP